jgi:uncharacterized protein (TIGR02147 family)
VIYAHPNYRSFLRQILAEKVAANPAFSQRALAGRLGISHSTLSEVLNGKKNFSAESALRVGTGLALPRAELEYFCLLVERECARTPLQRESVNQRLNAIAPGGPRRDLSVDQFRVISDWYHYAILHYSRLPDADFDPARLARRLGISKLEVEAAIERLLHMELLEADPARPGSYRMTQDSVRVESAVPNQALRNYHRQIFTLASESLERQKPDERIVGSETIAFAREDLPKARALVAEFYKRILELSRSPSRKTDVCNVGVHVFSLLAAAPAATGSPSTEGAPQ